MPRKPDLSIVGKRYGDLEVLRYTDKRNSYGRGLYECKCLLCGGLGYATKANLIRGEVKNCGCKKHEPKNDLTGKTFGRLTVTGKTVKNGKLRYICKCECGNTKTVMSQQLTNGNTKSCGCLQKEAVKKLYVEGTAPCKLKNTVKLRSSNTSGATGVWWDKQKNLWSAEIMFKRKKYFLGRYANKKDALRARERAEKEIFGNFLEWYEREYNSEESVK